MARRRWRLRIVFLTIGALATLVLSQTVAIQTTLLASAEVRQIRRLYRYAQQELGDRLDGVKLRFVHELALVIVVDRQGRGRAERIFEDITLSQIQAFRAAVAKASGIPEADLLVEFHHPDGVYTPRDRLIRLGIAFEPNLKAAAEEIAHAALCVPVEGVEEEQRATERKLDEAFAGTLGRIELLVDFIAAEGVIAPEDVAEEKRRRYAEFWRRAEREPEPALFTGSTVASEPYHFSAVTRAIVEEIATANIPLRDKFIRARDAIMLHTQTVE